MRINKYNLTWEQFAICNADKRTSFENMCRILFKKTILKDSTIEHSNPNNPGIEIEPVLLKETNKKVSFQAKYFNSLTSKSYLQIKDSAIKAIKYYKGKLDIIYLYCNCDLTTSAKTYVETVGMLQKHNIKLIPITNQTIFNQIMEQPLIATYYFLSHNLDNDWFSENVNESLRNLGGRYNKFNVKTLENDYIDLFLHNDDAAKLINHKKADAINKLRNYRNRYPDYRKYIEKLCAYIKNIEDVSSSSLIKSFSWTAQIKTAFADEIAKIDNRIKQLESYFKDINSDEYEKKLDKERELSKLEIILGLPDLLEINNFERNAITNKMIVVRGEAGAGKSQLFAVSAKKTLDSYHGAVLLLGQKFLNNDYLEVQLQSNLNINYSVEEFIQTLDCIGENNNSPVVIFIDAINESSVRSIWENGLIKLYKLINNTNYVRLAVSVRSGYEPFVFDKNINSLLEEQKITSIVHEGFNYNSIQAIKEFLDFYNITFYPTYMLDSNFSNPLFLNLFCKLYKRVHTQNDFNVFELFNLLVEKTNKEVLIKNDIEVEDNLVKEFIYTLVNKQIKSDYKRLTKTEILSLSFWDTYGLSKKLDSLRIMERAGVLYSFVRDEKEYYGIGYNLLEDYYSAKRIIEKYEEKSELRKYIKNELLFIEDGKVKNIGNNDIFVAICNLYAERYGEECIDIIEEIEEPLKSLRWYEPYISAYSLRKTNAINPDYFLNFCNKHHLQPKIVFQVLFENCVKIHHPLNAELLHCILKNKELNYRDYIWTRFINTLDYDDRLYQIVEYINKGELFSGLKSESQFLFLILLSWMLTSSNRYLRDNSSKAIVELLKQNFSLCLPILQNFEGINDPYVLQRLYGVVCGACLKRTAENKNEYIELVKYVYTTIFCKEKVYPDILLRDYARILIERFLYEYPNSIDITPSIINPPYNSDDIPNVVSEKYYQDEETSGMFLISLSMTPNSRKVPGVYGDFGRYILQSTIEQFENVDIGNIFHFAMQFIRDELGYKNELFSDFDKHYGHNEIRSITKKSERIGKKYQWITFYNILARLSDREKIKDWNDENIKYLGPWQLYIRDFDPTANQHFLVCKDTPSIDFIGNIDEFIPFDSKTEVVENWTKEKGSFFSQLPSSLITKDKNGIEWIKLYSHDDVEISENDDSVSYNKGEKIWAFTEGYFVKEKDFDNLISHLENTNLNQERLPETYTPDDIYLREYPWATSYLSLCEDGWNLYKAYTGEEKEVPSKKFDIKETSDGNIKIEEKDCITTEKVKEKVAEILPVHTTISWNSQYDASIEEAITIHVPCNTLIKYFDLKIREYEGYFYSNDDLVACEVKNKDDSNTLLFRKDYIDKFLTDNHYKLFWSSYGEKQFFYLLPEQQYAEWCGALYYDGHSVKGNISLSDSKNIND